MLKRTTIAIADSSVKWLKVYAAIAGESVSKIVEAEIAKTDWEVLAREAMEKEGT